VTSPPADARCHGDPAVYFAARAPRSDRRSRKNSGSTAAGRALNFFPFYQRILPWRFRLLAHHGPAGGGRNSQPLLFRRADAVGLLVSIPSPAARRARRDPPDRGSTHLCRITPPPPVAARCLHRLVLLRVLFPARLVAAARPLSLLQRAADRNRILPDRHLLARSEPFDSRPSMWLPAATLRSSRCADRAHERPRCWRCSLRLRAHGAPSGLAPGTVIVTYGFRMPCCGHQRCRWCSPSC